MRRRGGRWEGRSRRPGGRLLERLRELKGLGLRDVRALERPPGTPGEIELGAGKRDGGRSVVIVVSRRDGLDLVGWGQVAAQLWDGPPPEEVLIAAPLLGSCTRRAAQRAASAGPTLRLVTLPALAETPDELLDQELFPAAGESTRRGADPVSVLDRVLRVVDGAAAVTGCAGLRTTPAGFLLYVRGTPAIQITPEDEGAAVTFLAPDRRRVHVGEANFSRWGPELYETVVQLAQDPRLLSEDAANRERAFERVVEQTGCRVTGRWLPWNADGSDPADWVGIERSGRPMLGVLRPEPTLTDGPGWLAALHVLEEERGQWVPGAEGTPRLWLVSEREEPRLRTLLMRAGYEMKLVAPGVARQEAGELEREPGREREREPERERERERRGRRRPRRRRRERGDSETSRATPAAAPDERPMPRTNELSETQKRAESLAAPLEEQPPNVLEAVVASSEPEPEAPAEAEPPPAAQEELRWEAPGVRETEEPDLGDEEGASSDAVETEVEATLVEEREETEEGAAETIEEAAPRRRNPRAAIVVRNDSDSILAALILARDRRNLVAFWVCSQEGLMDFFKGRATDLPENADLLLVGFTAQPVPQEVISTAMLFRDRLQWFDHHEWPIEDVERLRDAIGRESIVFVPGASGPLAAVMQATERRSRFTDKMIDLVGRRLSENDMTKWGYRLVGLLERLAAKEGEHRSEIVPVLSGKPAELPEADSVYAAETAWVETQDPRVVHFGEYQMVVLRVPPELDPGEVGRRGRIRTGARLSLVSREGDELVLFGCNEEKRHINLSGMVGCVSARLPWAHTVAGGDRMGRLRIEDLPEHQERIESIIGEVVKHRAILYG